MSGASAQRGLVLPAMLLMLAGVLALLTGLDARYRDQQAEMAWLMAADQRERIERSALAHLRARAEQTDCGATPGEIAVEGEREGVRYRLHWRREAAAPVLRAEFSLDAERRWSWTRHDVELYGTRQTAVWKLADYFSHSAQIDNRSSTPGAAQIDIARIGGIRNLTMLYRLTLGPLRSEPLRIDGGRFVASLIDTLSPPVAQINILSARALHFPWDPATVSGRQARAGTDWPGGLAANLELIEGANARLSSDRRALVVELGGLLRSWWRGTRPNYGWALQLNYPASELQLFGSLSSPLVVRPQVEIDYRCACAQLCVGVRQDEVIAMASLTPIHGSGGGESRLVKHWPHRAHPAYRDGAVPAASYSSTELSFDSLVGADERVIGLAIEPAGAATDLDRHVYHVLLGRSINTGPTPLQSNNNSLRIVYGEAPASAAIGEDVTPLMTPATSGPMPAAAIRLQAFDDNRALFAGLALERRGAVHRYWTASLVNRTTAELLVEPVQLLNASGRYLAPSGTGGPIARHRLDLNDFHTVDGIDAVGGGAALLSSVRLMGLATENFTELGGLRYNDGALVRYSLGAERADLVNTDDLRHQLNNVMAISRFIEPGLSGGITDAQAQQRFPYLY